MEGGEGGERVGVGGQKSGMYSAKWNQPDFAKRKAKKRFQINPRKKKKIAQRKQKHMGKEGREYSRSIVNAFRCVFAVYITTYQRDTLTARRA